MFVFFFFVLICLLTAVCLMCRWAEPVRSPDHTERELQRKRHSYLGTYVCAYGGLQYMCAYGGLQYVCVCTEASGMRVDLGTYVCMKASGMCVDLGTCVCTEAFGTYVHMEASGTCVRMEASGMCVCMEASAMQSCLPRSYLGMYVQRLNHEHNVTQ